jgi:O-antigen biosynthesis protein
MLPVSQDPLRRREGAPRLIDWTGERCVPWAPDVQVVYEHYHRYLWAASFVAGRRVLDLASGEGFGSAILAREAKLVVGVDIDEPSVEHATLNYELENVGFEVGDARDLTRFEPGSFDAVVAFEMIEHLEEQELVLEQIERVLAPDGVLMISTPDRDAYDEAGGENPFHARELTTEGFVELLHTRFPNVATWGQRTVTGSAMAALEVPGAADTAAEARTFFLERAGEEWRIAPKLPPLYIVALASKAELPAAPAHSTLEDAGKTLIRAETRQIERQAEELREELDRRTALMNVAREEAAGLRARAAHDAHTISTLDAALNDASRRLKKVEGSVTWQLFQRVRGRLFGLLGGERSRAVLALQSVLRLVGRRLRSDGEQGSAGALGGRRRRPGKGPIELPPVDSPDVSLVIPLYAHAELTRAALESIRENTSYLNYEVILVDDCADAQTKALLRQVRGARVIANERNLGYLRSIARGAEEARGRWLVLCNNDIEVQPGWLAAMLDCGESSSDIAVVAPKFLAPDGTLAEAGGIVWRDGTGANYGRGEDPDSCHYQYRREIDYGSAAALMVRIDFWREVGGFDERFLPMYYEDTDLCFEARSRGYRVMYEPRAHVIHVEGATAGTDESAGHKRHQELNRPKFVEKWEELLAAEHLPNDQGSLWLGATRRRTPRVLVVDHRLPTWDRDSGGLRMRGIVEALLGLGCHVTFLPDNLAPLEPYTRELQRMGVEVLYGIELPGELRRIGPGQSLILLSRPQVASRWLETVREHAPDATIVYDTVDLHWVREARRSGLQNGAPMELSAKARSMRELELALIRAADATVVVTENERDQVRADVPEAAVHVVPNVNQLREAVPPPAGRRGLLFVGGFEHPPNTDAVMHLVGDVMPLVWRELEIDVTIVGTEPPPEVLALASETVDVKGWVQDLDPVIDSARALVAPLTYGAGLKGKVTQALAAGLPVVTTPVGAEGLDAVDGEHMLIGETPAELAERVLRVARDDALWQRLSQAGQALAAGRCSPALMASRLRELLPADRPLAVSGTAVSATGGS